MSRKESDKVTFHLSIGFVRATHTSTSTLKELGLDQEELDDMTDDELEEVLDEMQQEWSQNYIDSGWGWEDE